MREEFSSRRAATSATAVVSGIGSSAMMPGMLNQRSRTVALTSGVASEISTMPATIGAQASLAQRTALAWSAPSVFMTSQVAPSIT